MRAHTRREGPRVVSALDRVPCWPGGPGGENANRTKQFLLREENTSIITFFFLPQVASTFVFHHVM